MKRYLLTALLACIAVPPVATAAAAVRNVLFIAVDDLRAELGCYGSSAVKSPHIDQLASRGTLFSRAYCQQTVCNPSRASLLTGLRPDTLRVWDLPTHFRKNVPEAVTLPQLFKQNGYHAQCVGKIFHNWRQDDFRGDPASWSVPAILHYNTHYNDQPKVEGTLPDDLSTLTKTECRDVPDSAYYDGRVADNAIDALHECARRDQPFFLAVGFWKPHLPFNAPKKYWDVYQRSKISLPQNLSPPSNAPLCALTNYRIDEKEGLTVDDLRELHHGHLAAISYLDAQVGRVLDALDGAGLRDQTIVVCWSDHGLHLGEHGLWGKTTAFELDARVPLIIATPSHLGGQQTDALVELVDVYPTLVELCQLTGPDRLEGASLVPLLQDPAATVKEFVLTQTARPNYPRGELPDLMGYSLRDDRFRYTEWRDFRSGEVRQRELYDHQRDSAETANIADDPQYAGQRARLGRQLQLAVPARQW